MGERTKSGFGALSVRELEIVEKAAGGAVDKEIAADLGIRPSTLNGYWVHIRLKLGVGTRSEAVAICTRAKASDALEENERLRERLAELQTTNEALASRESELRNLFHFAPEGLLTLDRNGVIRSCNPRFAQMMCLTEGEVTGRSLMSLLDPESAATIRKKLNLRNKGVSSHYDLQISVRTGRRIWCRFSGAPVLTSRGVVAGIAATVIDISDRKRLELTKRVPR